MEQEYLKNEIQKTRDKYKALESAFKANQSETSLLLDDNKALHESNKLLKQELGVVDQTIMEYESQKRVLLEAKETLSEDIQQIEREIDQHQLLKANVISLEEQIVQLQQELNTTKENNTVSFEVNLQLRQCLINASNEIESLTQNTQDLETQLRQATTQSEQLQHTIIVLKEKLDFNAQNRTNVLQILQNNRALMTENIKFQKELKEVQLSNEEQQSLAISNEMQIEQLQINLDKSNQKIQELQCLSVENTSHISKLITQLSNVNTNLTEATDHKNVLCQKNTCLKDELEKITNFVDDQEKTLQTADQQLNNTLFQKSRLEKDMEAITGGRGETANDLKSVLYTLLITTRSTLDKIQDVLTEESANVKDSI